MITSLIAASLMAQAAPALATEVAYDELQAGKNDAAIVVIESNEALEEDDPARLINLGIAHARMGDEAGARELFRRAATSDMRAQLETATGEWRDSRTLAKVAMRKLDSGEFSQRVATAD